ncbi:MAG TPA: DegT/DnrJ/EryC1/StrS family aminotransferase [Acidimicrobiales bacterium]|nr:DegT/DnrJ/EryC1/StrS family aminotransferase [Acidimicrobiales bacterium]
MILALIDESLQTGSLTLGPHTQAFEEAFRIQHHVPYAVAVSSGTSALEIIFRTLGIDGREVIVPTNTFFATAAAVLHAGGLPRFADVAADTLALSEATVEAAITPATTAVVLVHIGGLISPEILAIRALCERRGLVLIEDAAHAHGSTLDDQKAGSFGYAAAFSFYPTKVVTSGEGGVIVTTDERLCNEAMIYRDQGKAGFLGGDHVRLGYAWRMSELHAAVGLVHLRRLDQFVAARQLTAAQYDEGLADLDGITSLVVPPRCRSNYYKYVALLAPGLDRSEIKRSLREQHGVGLSGEVYARPLHREPVFAEWAAGSFPVADDVCARHVCLPLHSDMSHDEAASVIEGLSAVIIETTRKRSTTV